MQDVVRPEKVLERIPDAQVVALDGGRILVWQSRGMSILGGIRPEAVEAVLARVDGRRSAEELARGLRGRLAEAEVLELLGRLLGEAIQEAVPGVAGAAHGGAQGPAAAPGTPGEARRLEEGRAEPRGPRVLVLGDGALSAGIAEVLGDLPEIKLQQLGDPAPSDPPEAGTRVSAGDLEQHLGSRNLVICALEKASHRTLLEVQRACLRAAVPALFVTADPDGVRVGPTTVPGAGPCLGCARLAGLRFLGLSAEAALEVDARFRSGRLGTGALLDAAVREVAAETAAVTAKGGEPRLLAALLHLSPTGDRRLFPLEQAPDCPLCGAEGGVKEPTQGSLAARLAPLAEGARLALAERRPRFTAGSEAGDPVREVGILGGGTAGYLAALALRRSLPHLRVTLVESPAVPVIGVGEATTPLMPQFLHADLGLDPAELFAQVRPTLKLGIRFLWGAPGDGAFNYPFGPVHVLESAAYRGDVEACSRRSLLMTAGRVPAEADGDGGLRLGLGPQVAYHLDNRRFVRYLRDRALARGVERVEATVAEVELTPDGREISALSTDDGRRLAFDLYLDCSGFRSLLVGGALGSPFVSFAPSLPTDAAVVAAAPVSDPIPPYTLAETMDAGWCWSTPQEDADHRGYVFSTAFLSPEAAEAEMRAAVPGLGEARLVRFAAGRRQHFWRGNALALGNAYGFVEPLESTALHMLIRQIGLLLRAFPLRRGEEGLARVLNARVAGFWDYLRWFLALHYRFNRRRDTSFWRACRDDVDVSGHGELLEAFRERGPLSYDRTLSSAFDYPDPLWGAEGIDLILLGQGVPTTLPRPAWTKAAWDRHLRLAHRAVARALPHQDLLTALSADPALARRLAHPFLQAGPAYPLPTPGRRS